MYPSPDLDLAIATATQRERIARGWRRRSVRPAQPVPDTAARRVPGRTAFRPGTSPA